MTFSAKAIEDAATAAVTTTVQQCPILSAYITRNDKGPAFDGYICIHRDSKQSKKGMRRVNVQVKGCVKKRLDRQSITYPMDIEDLKIYKENGGCLLFVVYINQTTRNNSPITNKKIYYQELTPVKIIWILAGTKAKTKPSVELKSFPQTPDSIADIMINFFENCRRQASFANNETLPNMEDLEKKGVIESFKILSWGYHSKIQNPAALSGKDIYLYAKIKDTDMLLPVSDQLIDFVDRQVIDKPVTVGGKLFYSSYTILHTNEESTIEIGQSFKIHFIDGKPGCTMNYKASHMLRVLNKDGAFILAAIENNGFEVKGVRIDLDRCQLDLSNFNIEIQRKNLKIFDRYVRMLDAQGSLDDIDLSKLANEDYRNLSRLATATLDHQPVKGLRPDLPPFLTLTVGELRFALWFEQMPEESNAYYIRNLMDYGRPVYTGKAKNKIDTPVPACIIFNDEDYLKVSNIQFEKFLSPFQQCEIGPFTYEIANDVMLRMITAYDKACGKRRKMLYETAMAFAEWLCSMPEDTWDKRIAKLNLLQLKKRSPGLSPTDVDELYEMAETSSDREDILTGVYLLLDQHDQAKRHFRRMPDQMQENLREYPIFHFWKE